MEINPNILTINPILYALLILPVIGIWAYATWGKEKISTGVSMCILDILPAFSLVFLNVQSPLLNWFIITILFAIISIRVHIVVGAVAYLSIYLTIGIINMYYSFSLISLIIASVVVIGLIIYVTINKKLDLWTKLGASAYGLFALVPLFYCFGSTLNPGFLSLAIGDILLGVAYIVPKDKQKIVHFVSNSCFYIGLWFVPLTLV